MAFAVITRSGSSEYAAAIAPLGLEVVEMPVMRAELVPHRTEGTHEIIAVASARAAAAVAAAVNASANTPEVWAVGAATQRALAELGVQARVPAGVVDGASLAAAIIAARSVAGARVWIPRARDGRLELADALRAAGAIVDDVVVYRTVAGSEASVADARALLLAKRVPIVIVLAPSQVRALAMLVGPLRDLGETTFVALGETTAAALRDEGVTPSVALTPTPAGIATALAAVYPKRT
ncbi:hypothetical protein BH11MYX2_BH11MYX2_16680 [soil metagenome]